MEFGTIHVQWSSCGWVTLPEEREHMWREKGKWWSADSSLSLLFSEIEIWELAYMGVEVDVCPFPQSSISIQWIWPCHRPLKIFQWLPISYGIVIKFNRAPGHLAASSFLIFRDSPTHTPAHQPTCCLWLCWACFYLCTCHFHSPRANSFPVFQGSFPRRTSSVKPFLWSNPKAKLSTTPSVHTSI